MKPKKVIMYKCAACGKVYDNEYDALTCCSKSAQLKQAKLDGNVCAKCEKPFTDKDKYENEIVHIKIETLPRWVDSEGELSEGYFHLNCIIDTQFRDIMKHLIDRY